MKLFLLHLLVFALVFTAASLGSLRESRMICFGVWFVLLFAHGGLAVIDHFKLRGVIDAEPPSRKHHDHDVFQAADGGRLDVVDDEDEDLGVS